MQNYSSSTRVLIIEDQASIRKLIGAYLRANALEVFEASSLVVARQVCQIWKPDVVLLDSILEDEDGLEFLREQHASFKMIVFSSRGDICHRIQALEWGAFDYLPKPVEPRELFLKIRLIHSLGVSKNSVSFHEEFADLKLNILTRKIIGPTELCEKISKMETTLVRMLLKESGVTYSKEDISRHVSLRSGGPGSRAVDVLVSKIRTKLRLVGSRVRLVSVRERGYMSVY